MSSECAALCLFPDTSVNGFSTTGAIFELVAFLCKWFVTIFALNEMRHDYDRNVSYDTNQRMPWWHVTGWGKTDALCPYRYTVPFRPVNFFHSAVHRKTAIIYVLKNRYKNVIWELLEKQKWCSWPLRRVVWDLTRIMWIFAFEKVLELLFKATLSEK